MNPEGRPTRFPRLPRRLRKLAIAFAAALVLGAVALLIFNIIVGRRWKRFERELAEAKAALPYVAPGRISLLEPHVPGNAWDGYFEVLRQMPPYGSREHKALHNLHSRNEKAGDKEIARTCIDRLQPALDQLREAARCERADGRAGFPPGEDERAFLGACSTLSQLARLDARIRYESGDTAGFLLRMSAIAQFALDLCRFPDCRLGFYTSRGMLADHLVDLADPVAAAGTQTGHLEDLSRLCETIEANLLTSAEQADFNLVSFCDRLREMPGQAHPGQQIWDGGKYNPIYGRVRHPSRLFSIREYFVELWDAERQRLPLLHGAESRPFAEVRAAFERELELHSDAWYSLLQPSINASWQEDALRYLRARCRLLRAALQLRQGLAPSNPDWPKDPWSLKPVGYRTVGDRSVLWCERADGDQGGVGEWRNPGEFEDLVLVLRIP